jgi:hypothetical protein
MSARRLLCSVFVMVVGVLVFASAPALAAAPETPETGKVSGKTASTATLEGGVLNPKAAGELGEYEYLYRVSATECEGENATNPEPALGFEKETIPPTQLTGLQPNQTYAVCLIERNAANPEEVSPASAPVTFTTLPAPPAVEGESVSSLKADEAVLEARVNPNNQATTYRFEYSASATGETLGAPITTIDGTSPLEGYAGQGASVSTGAVLHPEKTYYYRVIAENAQSKTEGKPVAGKVERFTTSPETPETLKAEPVAGTSATLHGVLNPHTTVPGAEAGSYTFLYRPSASECQGEGEQATPTTKASGNEGEAVSAAITGLLPATAYTVCLVAHNTVEEAAVGSPVTFTTPVIAPAIESESASNVDATEARLEATIDPDGAETAYHFEYGPSAGSYDVSLPVQEIRAGVTAVNVNTVATALKPGTTYHYRVLAYNSKSPAGGTPGDDEIFTTAAAQGTGSPSPCANEQQRAEQPYGLELPDCRAYEMVSPLDTEGQDATDSFVVPGPRAAVSGDAVTYASAGNFADPTGSAFEDQFVSRRGPGGWSTQEITPLHDPEATDQYTSYEGDAFTPELSAGIADTTASLTTEPTTGEYKLYLDDFANSSYRYVGDAGGYEGGLQSPIGTSLDLTHVVFEPVVSGQVLEWVNGEVVPVNVNNNGESMEARVGDGTRENEHRARDAWHAVSADGSRVYFTSPGYEVGYGASGSPGALYLRENAEQPQSLVVGGECTVPSDACTVDVSASERLLASPAGPSTPRFWGASADGSKVFFSSDEELTEDAYTGPAGNAANLYEYDLEKPEGERLKDLTVDKTDADGAAVEGVVQISEEGSYVYFVAEGDLAGSAVAGEPNLYVSHDGGASKFITTLAAGDHRVWDAVGKFAGGPEDNQAVVTPDGTRLAFMSEKSLTGYDNEQAEPGECEGAQESGECEEVYLYDAETGGLACASCNPSGLRPAGPSNLTIFPHFPVGEHRPRNLVESGALFFDSSDALVAHASDGRQNVYEYEDGRVYPISDVAGGFESFFMDASANGEDVFFGSADQLLPQDTSNNVVVYDARVGGGFPVTVAPPSCDNGDSCKPPPAPQLGVFGAPGSATFSGPGNIAPVAATKPAVKAKAKSVKCKKGYTKKKDKCVKKPKKKVKKAKKSSESKGSK